MQQKDVPEKMHETLELWEQFKERKDVQIMISTLVFTELYKCNKQKLSFLLSKLAQLDYKEIAITDSVRELANFYLENNVLKKKSIDDLTHIAAATLNLPQIGIFSPTMMLGGF